jgi:NAD(P)-dependent dehydrogenase (short-subunit alcohol dehydrogenase family)
MSGFGPSTTAEEVVSTLGTSLSGRNIFITGASSGIGVECARVLANAGANVWLAGRNVSKTEAVAQKIVDECGDSSRVHVIELDLSDLSSVHRCVTEFTSLNVPLHILLNNAGCMAVQEREETKDGHEMQIGTNHLG